MLQRQKFRVGDKERTQQDTATRYDSIEHKSCSKPETHRSSLLSALFASDTASCSFGCMAMRAAPQAAQTATTNSTFHHALSVIDTETQQAQQER